jgi:hypothetical protein
MTLPSPLGGGWRDRAAGRTPVLVDGLRRRVRAKAVRAEAAALIRSFGPPSPRGRRGEAALAARVFVSVMPPAAANHCGRRRSGQSSARSRKRRTGGMSSAKSMSPSANIQKPKTGRMARRPPMINSTPAGMRAQRERAS